jgi:hypothetical protein
MKTRKNTVICGIFAILAIFGLGLTGCGGGSDPDKQGKTVTSITVTTPTKTEYALYETLDLIGMKVTVVYKDGSTGTVTITAENISGFDSSTAGNKTVTVSYGGKTASFTVKVLPADTTLVSIAVTTPPTKTRYNMGEDPVLAGMIVTASYSNGSTAAVTGYTISDHNKTALGSQTITVNYNGKTADFTVNIIDPNLPTVTTPTATPAAGTFNTVQTVSLSCSTDGATIYYTIDGSNPTITSTPYSSAIDIEVTTTVKAIAFKEGMNDSGILTAMYVLRPVTPTADTVAGEILKGTEITLETDTEGAEIWYTTNGNEPAKNGAESTKYTTKITINVATTIKAVAVKEGWDNSEILTIAYTISKVATPTASPAAGTFNTVQTVTLSCSTTGAAIYYTTDGTTPTASSALYSNAISIGATTTLKAIAINNGMEDGDLLTAVYTINVFTSDPVLALTARDKSLRYTITDSTPAAGSYDIYWKEGNGLNSEAVKKGTKITGVASNGIIDGLLNDKTYSVLVTANKSGFISVDSTVQNCTTIVGIYAAVPTISVQPQNGIFIKTGTLSVTANSTDGGTLSYQWYYNTSNNNQNGYVIEGATGSSYTLSKLGTYFYYVIVTNTITDNDDGGKKKETISSNTANVTIELVIAEWAKSVSEGISDSVFNSVAKDAEGNIYAAGYQYAQNESYTYGAGVSAYVTIYSTSARKNSVLVKYDPNGNTLWARTLFQSKGESYFNAVAVDSSGNVYVLGYLRGPTTGPANYIYNQELPYVSPPKTTANNITVLVKYDSSGTAQWACIAGGQAIAVDSSGNVYTAGWGLPREGKVMSFLSKYDSSGNNLWGHSTSAGAGSNDSRFNAIAVDSSGNVYAAGSQFGTGAYTYGTGVSAQGGGDGGRNYAVLVKYDSNGNALWAKSVAVAGNSASSNESQFNAVTVDNSGNVYAAGYQDGMGSYTYGTGVSVKGSSHFQNKDVVLVKYNSSGNALWARASSTTDSLKHSYFNAVAVDISGNVYAAGYQTTQSFVSTHIFSYGTGVSAQGGRGKNAVLVKYDSSGTAQWAQWAQWAATFGSSGSEFNAVTVDNSSNVYAAGYQVGYGSYTYGGVSVQGTYNGGSNVLLVKYRN